MQKLEQTESSQEIEVKDSTPDSILKDSPEAALPAHKAWAFNVKRCMFLLMIIICSTVLGFEINAQAPPHIISHQTISDPEDFNFLVFCPISYFNENTAFSGKLSNEREELRRRRLVETYTNRIKPSAKEDPNFNASRTYLVEVTSQIYMLPDNTQQVELFYCGLVTGFYEDCTEAVVACSTPGPMFDIRTREPVDIIWVNNLNPDKVPDVSDSCFNETVFNSDKEYCTLMGKFNKTQTFLDPTHNDISSKTAYKHIPISNKAWPMTTHLHGAEIRPTFDGNPLSWIDNGGNTNGNYGIAAFTHNDECYYSAFDSLSSNQKSFTPPKIVMQNIATGENVKNFKINRYPNQQNPGSLWYHDHAMHLTSYNVQHGLSGYYILRDEAVEQQIGVDRACEKLVMIAGENFTASFKLDGFKAGIVYRFKFLNNNFNDGNTDVLRFSFSYGQCSDETKKESFTIIGADSSLFNTGIPNQKYFVVAQAERLELLIIFKEGQDSFSICGDVNIDTFDADHHSSKTESASIRRTSYNIQGIRLVKEQEEGRVCSNSRTSIDSVVLDVPFVDLRAYSDSQIAVKRMRPLLWTGNVFTINGRTDFHKGQSENPMLGTTEDWFIVNTIFFSHPIHVHLINFQVIREYELRRIFVFNNELNSTRRCSFYEMDFALQAIKTNTDPAVEAFKAGIFPLYPDVTHVNYTYLCYHLWDIYDISSFVDTLNEIFPEDKVDSNRVSGIDVRSKLTDIDRANFGSITTTILPDGTYNSSSVYKYVISEGGPSPKVYYSRWKDTAYVEAFKVLQYRIRWTKSNFTAEDATAGRYFHVPADQLREYPGFVYHCHILPHQDNEMMRPIMLQLPKNTQLDLETPCNYNIESKQPVLKWEDKYNCINKRCGNVPT